jgi:hypothetical protein
VNVTVKLHDLVADEPPYLLDLDGALAGGRRRRRTRTAVTTLVAGATGVVALSGVLVVQAHRPTTQQTLFGASPSTGATSPQGPIEQVVRLHTPQTWTFAEVHEPALDSFEADVDDGDGASRIYVGLSPSPGTLQQHPCSDPEFALDSVCREMALDADTRLITRGPAASGPVTSQYVVIVHRDGSGVDLGNDNATWRWFGGEVHAMRFTEEEKRRMDAPSVNRPTPVYSMAQLVEIAKAVDAATSGP